MKKNYCEFCGQELEGSRCDCRGLENLKEQGINIYNRKKKKCLYCGKKMFTDSNFCPNCGMPNDSVNVFDENLQKSLGYDNENALSHINEEEFKKRRELIEKNLNQTLKIKILLLIIIILLSLILVFKYVIPFGRQVALDMKFRNNNKIDEMRESSEKETNNDGPKVSEIVGPDENDEEGSIDEEDEDNDDNKEETTKKVIRDVKYKSEWVRRGGNFYAFDEEGEPIVNEWVEEVDEKTGAKSLYYFDKEGKLVTNGWVDNEYYVGADGKMLTNTYTPEGIRVDNDGKAILETEPTTTVEKTKSTKATQVFYDSPNGDGSVVSVEEVGETLEQSVRTTNNTGVIQGTVDKSAELYISSLKSYTTSYTKNDRKVNIKIYYPVIKGTNTAEVRDLNNAYKSFIESDFKDIIIKYINNYTEDLADITLNNVEQINMNKNRYWIKVSGRLTKATAKGANLSYRIRYDRKTGIMQADKYN